MEKHGKVLRREVFYSDREVVRGFGEAPEIRGGGSRSVIRMGGVKSKSIQLREIEGMKGGMGSERNMRSGE